MVCPSELTYVGINNIYYKIGNVQTLELLLEELLIWDKTIKRAQITYESLTHFQKGVRSKPVKRCRWLTNINNPKLSVASLDCFSPSVLLLLHMSCTLILPSVIFPGLVFIHRVISGFLKIILTSCTGQSLWYNPLLPLVTHNVLHLSKTHNVLHYPPNLHGS